MPKIVLTNSDDMKPERFEQLWREAIETTSPVDELVELSRELRDFEHRYDLESKEFVAKFNRGEMGDDADFFEWIGTYEMYQVVRKHIEIALMRAAIYYAEQETQLATSTMHSNEPHRIPA